MTKARATSPEPPTEPTFEETIGRLAEIVQRLERGDLALEESLRLFDEGMKLSRVGQERLDKAQKQVEQLLAVSPDGDAETAPFDARTDER